MKNYSLNEKLLELAAKAAGLSHPDGVYWIRNEAGDGWNPITDDGDALRLAVKLRFTIITLSDSIEVITHDNEHCGQEMTFDGQDPLAATRRAIVRAAAEIGRSMK
jgi:hypothetical protein